MTLKSGQYSEHFWDKEFNYVEPESILLTVLERLRTKIGRPVIITSGPRTVADHIEIYKKLERAGSLGDKKWHEVIPWGSRHLPAFGKKLRAVDLVSFRSYETPTQEVIYHKGDDLLLYLREIEDEIGVPLGLGVGKNFCHVDVDRRKSALWYYNY